MISSAKQMTFPLDDVTRHFLENHPEIRDMVPQFIIMLVSNVRVMLESCEKASNETEMSKIMLELKSKIDNLSTSIPEHFDKSVGVLSETLPLQFRDIADSIPQHLDRVSNNISITLSQLTVSINTLVASVSAAVSDKMDEKTDAIVKSIRPDQFIETITVRLQEAISQGESATRLAIEQLTRDVSSARTIVSERHDHVTSLLNRLPNDMTLAVGHATAAGSKHDTKMLALVQEMQNMVTKSAVAKTNAANDEIMIKEALNRLDQDVKKMFDEINKGAQTSHDRFDAKLINVFKEVVNQQSIAKKEIKDQNMSNKDDIARIPLMVKSAFAEVVKDMTKTITNNHSQSQSVLQGETRDMLAIRTNTEAVQNKLDGLVKTLNTLTAPKTAKAKGIEGEKQFYTALTDLLSNKPDGQDFKIKAVNGQAHNCDYSAQRAGHQELRLEVKAHSAAVGGKDVMRFKSDLEGLHLSGIMVSLHSGIVNKHTYQIERLSTGRFAMYLADNEYNMETVYNAIKILNEHDCISNGSAHTSTEHNHKISTETMRQTKMCLKEAGTKMDQLKSCTKTMISILSDMSFEKIENLLMSNNGQTHPITVDESVGELVSDKSIIVYHCNVCNKDFKNKGGYGAHVKYKHGK